MIENQREEVMPDAVHTPESNGRSGVEHDAVATAHVVDARLDGRALILGTLPPEGRDLDLVVRRPERETARSALAADGFIPRGPGLTPRRRWVEQLVRFRNGSAFSVDLNPAERWGMSRKELEALFAEARPVDGMDKIARPAPHHMLLLVARKVCRSGGHLDAKRRRRVERALAEDPRAWETARERAPMWGLGPALELLESVYGGAVVSPGALKRAQATLLLSGGPRWWLEMVARRVRSMLPRRTRIISLSGLDGAGKSSQSTALIEMLEGLGVDITVEWMPLGHAPRYRAIRTIRGAVGRALRIYRRARGLGRARGGSGADSAKSQDVALRKRSGAVNQAWTTVVALHQAIQHRKALLKHAGRGKVVIFDRYTPDAAAQLRFFYGSQNAFRFQKWLIDRISPNPRRSYLLEVPPAVVAARKPLQYTFEGVCEQAALLVEESGRLGVVRLDGERPREEITERIARELWEAAA
jgi:thymidylate kinase